MKVERKPPTDFPWTQATAPVVLTVPARRVEGWDVTAMGQNPPLPEPPFTTSAQTEEVELIPAGATQLRLSIFPVVGVR